MTGFLRRELPQNRPLREIGGEFLRFGPLSALSAGTGIETTGELVERQTQIRQAETGRFRGVPSEAGEFGGGGPLLAEPEEPKVHPEELNKRFPGVKFERPMTERAARIIAEGKRSEMIRNAIIARSPGALSTAATLAGGLIATAIDPLEVASAFVPVVSQARAAGIIARLGAVRGRAAIGMAEGAIGNLMVEPVFGALALQQQLDYGMSDALLNVGLGGAFGGVAGAAIGAVSRRMNIGKIEPPFSDVPVPSSVRRVEPPEIVRRMDNDKAIAAHRAALAQAAEGRSVDIAPFVRERADARVETITQWIARTGGINDADPSFRGEIAALGDRNIRSRQGPFSGRLARPGAKRNLDDLAEAAVEEGFIKNRDVRELLDAIGTDLRGEPVVRFQDMPRQMDLVDAQVSRNEADQLLDEFDAAREGLMEAGITNATPDEISRVGDIMAREGIDAEDAFERLAIQQAEEVAIREMDPRRDAVADFDASARIQREIDEAFDLEGDNDELLAMVDQMRQDGTLPRDAETEIADADAFTSKARAYGRTAKEAAACLAR